MKIIKELRWALIAFASLVIFFGVCFLLIPTNKNEHSKESSESRVIPSPNATAVVSQYSVLVEKNSTEANIPEGKSKKFEHKPSEVRKEERLFPNPSDRKLTDLVFCLGKSILSGESTFRLRRTSKYLKNALRATI